MKRLLLSILAALALPTAVNALPFRDIVIKTGVGEKYTVKNATVSLQENYYKSDYIKMMKEYRQRNYKRWIKEIKEGVSFAKMALSNGGTGYTQKYLVRARKEVKQSERDMLSAKSQRDILIKSIYRGLEKGGVGDNKHAVLFNYRIIFEDLNGYKQADYYRSFAFCLNPKLRVDLKSEWRRLKGSGSVIEKSSDIRNHHIRKAICDKYANF